MTQVPTWPDGVDWNQREDAFLAPYAMRSQDSRGRKHPELPHPFRSPFQRDRDRLVHCTAFRRLMYKTQVLVAQTNDHHRTRLTHSLEVAMISRTIARRLGLNEDLTETIALSHDLGHPPFGHAGERALNECMKNHGGFEHNVHGMRIVQVLEYRYAEFPGLNLSWEALEAMAYHAKRRDVPEVQEYLAGGKQPLLEAQVVDAADSLAYDTHDIDDALSVGLITMGEMQAVPFWQRALAQVRRDHGELGPLQLQPTVVRALIDWQVTDLLTHTMARLRQTGIQTVDEVRNYPEVLVAPGSEVCALKADLEAFLRRCVYQHHRVQRMAAKGSRIIHALFNEFCRAPQLLPERYAQRALSGSGERTVCDYLAGMTDRYAQEEYQRLFQPFTTV